MISPQTFFVTAPKGVVSVLIDELRELGVTELREQPAGVEFKGDLQLAYRICLWSRCAGRVLMPLTQFDAADAEALYAGVQTIDWSEHLNSHSTLAVDFTSTSGEIRHTQYGAQKVKDAIVDQFRDRCGERPSVDLERPDLRINVHQQRNQVTVGIDLSGDSLHKRGYRRQSVIAPLKENLAAALLLRSGWPEIAARGGCLLDPMCGSGTFLVEAAWMATDRAPGLGRDYFGFLGWLGHDSQLWQQLMAEAQARADAGRARLPRIIGFDVDQKSVNATRENIEAADLADDIVVARRGVAELVKPSGCDAGLLMVNPPYGQRLGEVEELRGLYRQLGDRLKQQFAGWQAAVFTGNPDLAKEMGIRAQRWHTFFNGALECRLLRFEIDAQWFIERRAAQPPRPLEREAWGPGAEMFANRLRKNLKQLGAWAKKENVTCYRLYDADMPEYALAIDVYQGEKLWLHVQEYEAPKTIDPAKAKLRLREAIAMLLEVLAVPLEQVFFKVRRQQKGKAQYEKVADERDFYVIEEGGHRFWVNFSDFLDTGLFLDHRLTRTIVECEAKGKRFLNLFAYTGTVTVYAAAGGAKSTTTVDMSNTYLNWARRNLELNKIADDPHEFVQADCLQWLEQQRKSPWAKRFDLIFLDPPTFSTSKRMENTFDVQRDHVALIRAAVALLDKDGMLIFSNNFRKFNLDADALSDLSIEDISAKTIPADFARNPKIHRCWQIRVRPT
ncbi:MAG: bifunctional 23S rRNA (guanine(2069)-N(7))-methyltransferase RlmK/23S rRNA (guanine(2445)-N(2))-methyltransferase RlmL [Gammaproteobacteria bacterium]|nr:bifunctional 23S rRNA (guanine(2069)-N(7))-methyltransferase RlmK/23S rRNA (guanine(2445)-N(2))-methyltransferase RlmL [Gammaproteobacteria bacterium]